MATLSVIGRWALREQLSIQELVRRTGLSRCTIRKQLQFSASGGALQFHLLSIAWNRWIALLIAFKLVDGSTNALIDRMPGMNKRKRLVRLHCLGLDAPSPREGSAISDQIDGLL